MRRTVRIAVLCASALVLGCGARTSLGLGGVGSNDTPVPDASLPDTSVPDVSVPDVSVPDVSVLDVSVPDVVVPPDVVDAALDDQNVPPGCDGGARDVWLLTNDNRLFLFDPVTVSAREMGPIDCPYRLNSMTVSRSNVGYIGAQDGRMYTLDLATRHCTPTPFNPSQFGISSYGMGFVADPVASGERLYIAPQDPFSGQVNALGIVDVFGSYTYSQIGVFAPVLPPLEVSGTGDGRLYGVHVSDGVSNGELLQIDKRNAAIIERIQLPVTRTYTAFDFVIWGGSFYIFMTYASESRSRVIFYTPGRGDPVEIATIDPVVIGAGVSTCAPL